MAGLMLAFLGAGNWLVGLNKTRAASQMIAQAAHTSPGSDYRSFDEVDSAGAVLKPFTEEGTRPLEADQGGGTGAAFTSLMGVGA